jgi:hypothetical protein
MFYHAMVPASGLQATNRSMHFISTKRRGSLRSSRSIASGVGPQVMGRDQSAAGTRSKATGDHPRDISGHCAKSLPNSPSLVTSTSGAFSFQLRPYSQCLQLKLSVGRQRPSYMRTFAACVWSRSRSRKGCASPRLSFNRIETHCGFCAFMGPSVPSRRSPTGR